MTLESLRGSHGAVNPQMLAGSRARRVALVGAGRGAVTVLGEGAQATAPARTTKRASDWRVLCPQGVVNVANDRLRPFSDCLNFDQILRRSARHPAHGRLLCRFAVSPRCYAVGWHHET